MPYLAINGVKYFYTDSGAGSTGETIVFSHGLLWSGRMFERQIQHFQDRYRCIAYDHRGQGRTEVTAEGYDMDTLYQDAVALLEALNLEQVHFVGLSMGGFVGMRMAARQGHRLKSLILLGTTADPEPAENVPKYRRLNLIARYVGFKPVTRPVMKIMFGATFRKDPKRAALRMFWQQQLWQNDRIGITRAVQGLYSRQGIYEEIHHITVPTLIVVGMEDTATIPAKSERMHAQIQGSKLVKMPRGGHTSTVEEPELVNEAMETFLAAL